MVDIGINTARAPETAAEAAELVRDAGRRAAAYVEGVRERAVVPTPEAMTRLRDLREPLPEGPTAPDAVLAILDEIGSPATMASTGGRYFGFITGGSVPAAMAANILAAAWDQNVALRSMSPIGAALDDVALAWLRDLLGLPAGSAGSLVTGATMANFTCIAAARTSLLKGLGWNVESQGLFGAPPLQVVVSEEVHASVQKALALVGFGRDRVTVVPTDGQGRMRVECFPRLDSPSLICIQAGNVNTGGLDPADEICDLARVSGSWVHVDGALGLWALCAPGWRHLLAGVTGADSWATDAHKWLNVPYDCGIAFVREAESMYRAMNADASYLPEAAGRDPMRWSPEMSQRARGVAVWAALKSLGRAGVAEIVDRTCRFARLFASELADAGFKILNEVVLNQVLVSFGTDEFTREVIAALQREGACWCSGSVWHGRACMRISVSSWATTESDVRRSVEAMARAARECRA
ncbi:MAG TPA: aminotransferase class V-fold PLP-dependent enzyme [Bryobacteraceae bacterium]|nr:aminotransferase class V-fold PLP-dependent enzyme [Bryobacteraceae bacterium]